MSGAPSINGSLHAARIGGRVSSPYPPGGVCATGISSARTAQTYIRAVTKRSLSPGTMSLVTDEAGSAEDDDETEPNNPYEDYIFKRNPLRFLENLVRNISDSV